VRFVGAGFDLIGPVTRIPSRSRLIRLQPMGLGTAYRESLTSYFMRLADAHFLAPRTLVGGVIFPPGTYDRDANNDNHLDSWRRPTLNGMGAFADKWVRQLEELTGNRGLRELTMGFLSELISTRGLVSDRPRWCPSCFREGALYGQLLWCFDAVTCCPKHGARLIGECGCGPDEVRFPGTVKILPHVCPKCGVDLGSVGNVGGSPPTEREIRRARLVADLLTQSVNAPGAVHKRGLADFLSNSIQWHFEGNAARFGRRIGVSKSTLHGWLHGGHIPDFDRIVTLSEAHNCSIMEVLLGRFEAATPSHHVTTVVRSGEAMTHQRRALDWDTITRKLEESLVENPPIHLRKVAERMGVRHETLRRRHPDICATISQRWLDWRRAFAVHNRLETAELVRKVAQGLALEGIHPTWRHMLKMGLSAKTIRRHQAICHEVWREHLMTKG